MNADEGVIKFRADHTREPLDARRYGPLVCTLIAWREILAHTGLVGQDPARYGGAGYGNVSARVGPRSAGRGRRAMIVSGTQTGGLFAIGLDHFCLVERYDYEANRVRSRGPLPPSSETMTHGAVYDLSPAIRYVFHGHGPILWRRAAQLRIPTTDASVPYGTPAMAREVHHLWSHTHLPEVRILAMAGHEDGILVFGKSAEQAGRTLVSYLARAYTLDCARPL